MSIHVYRLVIEYPEGSRESRWPEQEWRPEGWEPLTGRDLEGDGLEDQEFRWPAERLFLSRSGARHRAGLLRGWGAKVTILPSLPVEWPTPADGAP